MSTHGDERCVRHDDCIKTHLHGGFCQRADGTIILKPREAGPIMTTPDYDNSFNRLGDIIDECIGLQPVMTPSEMLTLLESTLVAYRLQLGGNRLGLGAVAARMNRGRSKYPNGCTVLSLVDEVGELVHAVNKGESVDRCREELLDVAAVAMRLYLGEVDTKTVQRGLRQIKEGA